MITEVKDINDNIISCNLVGLPSLENILYLAPKIQHKKNKNGVVILVVNIQIPIELLQISMERFVRIIADWKFVDKTAFVFDVSILKQRENNRSILFSNNDSIRFFNQQESTEMYYWTNN